MQVEGALSGSVSFTSLLSESGIRDRRQYTADYLLRNLVMVYAAFISQESTANNHHADTTSVGL